MKLSSDFHTCTMAGNTHAHTNNYAQFLRNKHYPDLTSGLHMHTSGPTRAHRNGWPALQRHSGHTVSALCHWLKGS